MFFFHFFDQYPKTIDEVIHSLDNNSLREGDHVEFKAPRGRVNYEAIAPYLVRMANSGGGILVFGVTDFDQGIVKVTGISPKIEYELSEKLHYYLNQRTDGVNCRLEFGEYSGQKFAVVFVEPSVSGTAFIKSEKNPANRTYYYWRGDKDEAERVQYQRLFKYMTVDAFILSLENMSWRFWEPTRWKDKYERRFYCANYENIPNNDQIIRRVFATCLTKSKNSEAAWKVYVGNEGLQTHCVQLEIDVTEFRKQLESSGNLVIERTVKYYDEKDIMGLHMPSSNYHKEFFEQFDFSSFINLLSIKRNAYSYENEIRFFIVEPDIKERGRSNNPSSLNVSINWEKIIKSIRIDEHCSDAELIALRSICWRRDIDLIIKKRKLPKPAEETDGMRKVEATLFDIDNMPGAKRIKVLA